MQNLVICGDSWGCGAWSDPPDNLGKIHFHIDPTTRENGLDASGDDYFSKRWSKHYQDINCPITVNNVSAGADSNISQLQILAKMLNGIPVNSAKSWELLNGDYHSTLNGSQSDTLGDHNISETQFLFIQTDPIRDILTTMTVPARNDRFSIFNLAQVTDPHNFFLGLLECTYMQLDFIAKQYNIIVNITGGCSDIAGIDSKYTNLNVVCDSFYSLLDSDHKNSIYSTTQQYQWQRWEGREQMLSKADGFKFEGIIDGQYDKTVLENRHRSTVNEFGPKLDYFGYGNDPHPSHKGIDMWIEHMLPRMK